MAELSWQITVRQIIDLHEQAVQRFDAGQVPHVDVDSKERVRGFLDKIENLKKYDAFTLTHKQLRFLCRLADVDAGQFITLREPYVWQTRE